VQRVGDLVRGRVRARVRARVRVGARARARVRVRARVGGRGRARVMGRARGSLGLGLWVSDLVGLDADAAGRDIGRYREI